MHKKASFSSILVMITVCFTSCDTWKEVWGDHSLGDNFSLLEGDKKEDRIIVYCTGRSGGACFTGIQVIPFGSYGEYVLTADSDDKWIVAKTMKILEKQENYWIISKDLPVDRLSCESTNCDSILQSRVTGPMKFKDFNKKIKGLRMDLDFNE